MQREREEGKSAVEEQSRCKGNSNRGLLGKWQTRQNAAMACALCTGGELEFLIKRCIRHRKSCFKQELNFSPNEHGVLYPRHEIHKLKALASASFRDFFLQSCGVVLSLKAGS